MSFDLYHGDCLEVLKTIPENSIDSIVTDPPYELSNDGKQSAAGVFLEFAFPQNAKIEAKCESGNCLSFLVDEILGLGDVRSIPSPSSAVPVVSVALNDNTPLGKHDVEHDSECSVGVSKDAPAGDVEAQGVKHLGCFALKLTDRTKALQVLNKVGAGFVSRGVGVGFGVHSASHPGALHGLASVVSVDDVVGLRDGSLSDLIGALAGAAASPVFCLDLRRGAIEEFSANSARLFASILLLAGAELVRADAATGCLPAMFEARRVCVVDDSANRAFTFDLIVHEQIIASNGFMGKEWDGSKVAFNVELWAECLRVLKPGGHLLAFSGTRTQHRMVCAIEDAGFEIRDMIAWVYGSGFPKSLDVSKAIDKAGPPGQAPFEEFAAHYEERRKAAGLTHAKVCAHGGWHGSVNHGGSSVNWANGYGMPTTEQWPILRDLLGLDDKWAERVARIQYEREVLGIKHGTRLAVAPGQDSDRSATGLKVTAPGSEAARQWQGWGTALKPALEPITVARKPLVGTVAANVLEHGTGALNIDGCRVPAEKATGWGGGGSALYEGGLSRDGGEARLQDSGRWPANLIHDGSEEVLLAFPDAPGQQGDLKGHNKDRQSPNGCFGKMAPARDHTARVEVEKSAARFFYCAKASKKDRDEGLDDQEDRILARSCQAQADAKRGNVVEEEGGSFNKARIRKNNHPTVKPTDLMRYLVRLVTPPGGVVLDPFMGSGSTGKAAMLEGFRFIGCEMSPEYLAIAEARIMDAVLGGLA